MQLHDFDLSANCYKVRLFLSLIGQRAERVPPAVGACAERACRWPSAPPAPRLFFPFKESELCVC